MIKLLALLSLVFLSSISYAAVTGKVIKIADGDTLTILTGSKEQVRVRLAEIDAPEKRQAFGAKSSTALSGVCFGKRATLKSTSKDHYGRTLARVYCGGVDANAEMIKLGMAWVYDRYAKDKGLYILQDTAKSESLGLWVDKAPIPPWEFRRNKRKR